ncbi:MAG: hypothetical protein WAM73_02110 [Desulfobacterales bacterium]
MKKFMIIALAVVLVAFFAAVAMANEWNLYGSARMATFYTSQDLSDGNAFAGRTVGTDQFGRDSVDNLNWELQSNSRVGAKVKGDMLEGQFEFAVTSDGSGGNVGTRRLYGVWKFADDWGLKVGKDYTPITFFLSGQVFDADQGLKNVGQAYGFRRGQLALEGHGFKVALISPTAGVLTREVPLGATVQQTTETYIPKIEASYQFNLSDAMSLHAFGGYQAFTLYQSTTTAGGAVLDADDDVSSYMAGVGADLGFGPFFVKPQVSWYRNGAAAGWLNALLGLGGPRRNGVPISQLPVLDVTGGLVDVDSLMAMLAIGFSPTEMLRLEAGGGYLYSDYDNGSENTYMEYYLQAVVTLAKGVYIVPEVGFRDYGDFETNNPLVPNINLGDLWYAGAKWQIDF